MSFGHGVAIESLMADDIKGGYQGLGVHVSVRFPNFYGLVPPGEGALQSSTDETRRRWGLAAELLTTAGLMRAGAVFPMGVQGSP